MAVYLWISSKFLMYIIIFPLLSVRSHFKNPCSCNKTHIFTASDYFTKIRITTLIFFGFNYILNAPDMYTLRSIKTFPLPTLFTSSW